MIPVEEAVRTLGEVTGIRGGPRMLSPALARATGWMVGMGFRVLGRRAPFCPEMAATLLHGHAYDGSKAVATLGLSYTPFAETLRKAVAWYVANGHVTRSLPGFPPR